MRFCGQCGSRMRRTTRGYECPKCRTLAKCIPEMQREPRRKGPPDHVYVLERKEENLAKVRQKCPECGNTEATRWFISITGEHAGIGRDTTVAHFRCTKCSHGWTKTY